MAQGSKTVKVDGKVLQVPADATPDEIDSLARGGASAPRTIEPSPAGLANKALEGSGIQVAPLHSGVNLPDPGLGGQAASLASKVAASWMPSAHNGVVGPSPREAAQNMPWQQRLDASNPMGTAEGTHDMIAQFGSDIGKGDYADAAGTALPQAAMLLGAKARSAPDAPPTEGYIREPLSVRVGRGMEEAGRSIPKPSAWMAVKHPLASSLDVGAKVGTTLAGKVLNRPQMDPAYSRFEPNQSGPPQPEAEAGPLHDFEHPVDQYLPNKSGYMPDERPVEGVPEQLLPPESPVDQYLPNVSTAEPSPPQPETVYQEPDNYAGFAPEYDRYAPNTSAPPPEPVWPANYTSPAPEGGGANYTAADLAALKAQHGIDQPQQFRPSLSELMDEQGLMQEMEQQPWKFGFESPLSEEGVKSMQTREFMGRNKPSATKRSLSDQLKK